MVIDLYEMLSQNEILLTFVVIGIGYLLGRIKLGPIEIGPTTGVLIAALVAGHLGHSSEQGLGNLGFTLFIFCVGLQAGPSFFSVFLENGKKYLILAAVVAAVAVAAAVSIARVLDLDYGMDAGMLAGALTSTPTLAGAEDAINSGLAVIPEGMSAAQASSNLSVGYAITYIFGTLGLILFIRFFPKWMGVDLVAEARKAAEARGLGGRRRVYRKGAEALPLIRAYRVEDKEFVGKSIADIRAARGTRVKLLKIRRGDKILEPDADLVVEKGDIVALVAPVSMHEQSRELAGPEVFDPELLHYEVTSEEIIISKPDIPGKKLGELNLLAEYGCVATAARRANIDLPVDDHFVLQRGDRIQVTGEKENLRRLSERLGHIEREIAITDLLTISMGVGAGLAVGMLMVKVGDLSIGLGSAGGLLIAGIVIGYLHHLYPTFGGVPEAARTTLMDLGLMLFMAGVGLKAGAGIVEAFASVGLKMVAGGALVTMAPVVVGYFFGRKALKLNPAILMGAITGAMTSTPALNIVQESAKSSMPALGYAGTYTFANVFLTFAGTLMMFI